MPKTLQTAFFHFLVLAIFSAPSTGIAQSDDSGWTLPRTVDGQPDLQGVWANNSATPLERPDALAEKATLIATLEKIKPVAKVKVLNRVNSVVIDKSSNKASGTGSTTLNDGLTFGNYPFGTRVQDEEISLNTPDIT